MKPIKYTQHARFERQFKKLIRKYRSLDEDLKIAKKYAIEAFHIGNIDNESVELVPKLDRKIIQIYKIRKFACKALKGKGVRSGIRVIYAFYPQKFEVEFLEIYFKEKSSTDMDYDFACRYVEENA